MSIFHRKPDHESIEDELCKERATVLARAAERLSRDLERMAALEHLIEEKRLALINDAQPDGGHHHYADVQDKSCRRKQREINAQILKYNRVREEAQISAYYLRITREAMGLRNHKWVEEYYPIPGKKDILNSIPGKGKP